MGKNKPIVKPGEHFDAISFHSHIMMDALAKHLLGLAPFGMTDIGEVLETYCNLKGSDEEAWLGQWSKLGDQLLQKAEEKNKEGHKESAETAYLRASTYYRVALMCYSNAENPKMISVSKRSHECYEKYLELSGYPGTYVEIPYESTYLPGHFYQSPTAIGKAPLMILMPGRDTWAEDTRWMYDGLLKRGIHCLIFDGPGQGYALRLQKMPFRPDWENVMTPVIDFAIKNYSCVDEEHVGAMGFSFGAFLLPRACAFEKRIKLGIVNPGNINWGGHFADIFAKVMKLPAPFRPKMVYNMMDDYAWKHGVSREAVIEELRKYDNTDIVDKVNCEMLVLDGTAEINKGEAKVFYDALQNCKKEYKLFDETSTSQCHAQMGGYVPAAEFICDWVKERL